MTEEKKIESVDTAGSPVELKADPNKLDDSVGQSAKEEKVTEEMVPKSQYAELEKKLGEQGEELGNLRKSDGETKKWFEEANPLLDKLDGQDVLIKAIMDGKVDSNLAQAVSDGKVSMKDAEEVTKAHEDVKKDLGDKKYKETDSKEINKLVDEKVSNVKEEVNKAVKTATDTLERKITEKQRQKDFIEKTKEFIKNTPDYAEYANDVNKYMDERNLSDIEVGYNAVKGIRYEKEKGEYLEKQKAEEAKKVALNAGGGSGRSSGIITDADEISNIVATSVNPNRL